MLRRLLAGLLLFPVLAHAETWESIRERKPDLFHPTTGLRIESQRAPTPENIPAPVTPVTAADVVTLLADGALAIDVFGALQSRYDELDGTWLVDGSHESLPGAVWLPEVGRGTLTPDMQHYLESNLEKLTEGNPAKPLVLFCVADCWMSWNASQRVSGLGYEQVYWFRHGTDGWLDAGLALEAIEPEPVNTDF